MIFLLIFFSHINQLARFYVLVFENFFFKCSQFKVNILSLPIVFLCSPKDHDLNIIETTLPKDASTQVSNFLDKWFWRCLKFFSLYTSINLIFYCPTLPPRINIWSDLDLNSQMVLEKMYENYQQIFKYSKLFPLLRGSGLSVEPLSPNICFVPGLVKIGSVVLESVKCEKF